MTKAVVGTINMDYRSLYLHFECAAYIYNEVIKDVEGTLRETLAKSRKCVYHSGGAETPPWYKKFAGAHLLFAHLCRTAGGRF